jgi:AraC family transcriptional regulator
MHFAHAQFPAAVIRSRTKAGLTLTETRYGAGAALPTHSHEYACLVVVLQGAFRERFGAKTRDGAPGMVIVRPAGEPHSDRFEERGGRCLNVELSPRWLERVRDFTSFFDDSAAFTGGSFLLAGRRLHAELSNEDDVSPLAVESIVLSMVADSVRDMRRTAGAPPRWLLSTQERLHSEFASRWTLDALAASAGVHPAHLASTFRRFFGRGVAAYVRQLRIEYACRALAESDLPLADIALAAGFSDQSHFGRAFRQAMRVTPAQYRAWSAAAAAAAFVCHRGA